MKRIKNTSLQGLSITLTGDNIVKSIYLMPGNTVTIPSNLGGNILRNLVSRRMVKVSEIAEAAAPVPLQPVKVLNKVLKRKVSETPTTQGK